MATNEEDRERDPDEFVYTESKPAALCPRCKWPLRAEGVVVNADDLRAVLLPIYMSGDNVYAVRAARDRLRATLKDAT